MAPKLSPRLASDVQDTDILLGQRGGSTHWKGNIRLRQIADESAEEYDKTNKYEREDLVKRIEKEVQSYGGRFLRELIHKDEKGDVQVFWEEVDSSTARRKIKTQLNDASKRANGTYPCAKSLPCHRRSSTKKNKPEEKKVAQSKKQSPKESKKKKSPSETKQDLRPKPHLKARILAKLPTSQVITKFPISHVLAKPHPSSLNKRTPNLSQMSSDNKVSSTGRRVWVDEVSPNDVIIGENGASLEWEGNLQLRDIVEVKVAGNFVHGRPFPFNTTVMEIIAEMEAIPSRFLVESVERKGGAVTVRWLKLPTDEVREILKNACEICLLHMAGHGSQIHGSLDRLRLFEHHPPTLVHTPAMTNQPVHPAAFQHPSVHPMAGYPFNHPYLSADPRCMQHPSLAVGIPSYYHAPMAAGRRDYHNTPLMASPLGMPKAAVRVSHPMAMSLSPTLVRPMTARAVPTPVAQQPQLYRPEPKQTYEIIDDDDEEPLSESQRNSKLHDRCDKDEEEGGDDDSVAKLDQVLASSFKRSTSEADHVTDGKRERASSKDFNKKVEDESSNDIGVSVLGPMPTARQEEIYQRTLRMLKEKEQRHSTMEMAMNHTANDETVEKDRKQESTSPESCKRTVSGSSSGPKKTNDETVKKDRKQESTSPESCKQTVSRSSSGPKKTQLPEKRPLGHEASRSNGQRSSQFKKRRSSAGSSDRGNAMNSVSTMMVANANPYAAAYPGVLVGQHPAQPQQMVASWNAFPPQIIQNTGMNVYFYNACPPNGMVMVPLNHHPMDVPSSLEEN